MFRFISAIIFPILFLNGCVQEPIIPELKSSIKQIGKCSGTAFSKAVLSSDSSFKYSFSENLIIDFMVVGNCCPDSNRFDCFHELKTDSLIVYVKDIEENLCKCNCRYLIHGEFKNIAQDYLTIKCIMKEKERNIILYIVDVKRNYF